MASEPPSLEEPLVRLNSNLQGWLDQVLRSFAAQLSAESQAQHERLEALAQDASKAFGFCKRDILN